MPNVFDGFVAIVTERAAHFHPGGRVLREKAPEVTSLDMITPNRTLFIDFERRCNGGRLRPLLLLASSLLLPAAAAAILHNLIQICHKTFYISQLLTID